MPKLPFLVKASCLLSSFLGIDQLGLFVLRSEGHRLEGHIIHTETLEGNSGT